MVKVPEYYYLKSKKSNVVEQDSERCIPRFFGSFTEAEEFRNAKYNSDEWEIKQFAFNFNRGDQ